MINDPELIEQLLKELDLIPNEIIKQAIKDVINEDEKENSINVILDGDIVKKYSIKENYNYTKKFNIYVHNNKSNNWLNLFRKKENNKDKEVEVA